MSIRLRGLHIGDILVTNNGKEEVYVYLGRYRKKPNNTSNSYDGYLYCYIGKLETWQLTKALSNEELTLDRVARIAIASFSIEQFGKFNKYPITFDRRIGNVDINKISEYIGELQSLHLKSLDILIQKHEKFKNAQ